MKYPSYVKCRLLDRGPGPREVLVEVDTVDGPPEQVIVSETSVEDNVRLGVLGPIEEIDGRTLVELPRESVTGRWRIWVSPTAVA
jgi:hypothetical protein